MPHLRPRLLSRIRFRPSDGSECSDFVEIAECNGSYQEVYSRSKTRALVAAYANGTSPEPTRNTVVDTMVLRDRPFQTTCGLISIVPNKPTAKSSATAASKPVPTAAMIPVLSVAPAPQTTATTPLSITTSTETSRQYPRGQRRQSNLGRVWQRWFDGNRCRNFPEDHRHSVAGSSGRVSTRFRKWSGLRQSPQVTYDRSCAIADQESWRQPGPSRSPATISQWRSVETRNRSSPFSATPRSSACSRSKTVRSCPAWAAYVPA